MIINGEQAYRYKKNKNYYVTKSGLVYSTYVVGGQGRIDINNPHLLKYGTDKDGYYRVVLSFNGSKQYVKVHTIIAEQFIGDIENGLVVNHLDGNIHNNCVDNLEITTVKENTIHAHKNGLTSREIKIDVEFKNQVFHFNSLTECMIQFKDLSRHYIDQIKNKIILYSMVLFEKDSSTHKINSFYNGKLYKVFNTMKEADFFFDKSPGTTSSAMINNLYRKKINQYTLTFPNVSTIESADLI